ncbi:MAG: hemolysin family protein [Candidatus Falkowbacteria bacterium]
MEYFIILILVTVSALFSGLTLGYFSLNKDDLGRKAKLGDKNAQKAYRIRKKGNLLLCTLLIGNVATNSVLSVFLGSVTTGVLAALASTFLIVIFGEILPQAVFSRYALIGGSRFAWLADFFIFIFYPICYPLSRILDKFLGSEIPTVYSKRELIKLIEDHEDNMDSEIDADEERIIKGALSFSDKKVDDIMTPRSGMYALPSNRILDKGAIIEISSRGHSRIPVYRKTRDDMVGLLYVKDLIRSDWSGKTVGEIARTDLIFVSQDKKLDELLNDFKKTRHHLFVVINKYGDVQGLVTIEDVMEEIIGEEIVDEFDRHVNLQEVAKNNFKAKGAHVV